MSTFERVKTRLCEPQFRYSKIGHFLDTQKVRLRAVDLGHQKVRLRAVWMGRNLGLKLGLFLGSKIRVEKWLKKETDFCPQKAP